MWALDAKIEADECEFPWAELTWGLIDWKRPAYMTRKFAILQFNLIMFRNEAFLIMNDSSKYRCILIN